MHNFFLVYLYLSISTCFKQQWAHRQEKQLRLCDTWYLLFCVDDCLVRTLQTRQSSIQDNKYQVSYKHRCLSWRWAHCCLKHVEIDKYKYTKKKLCTKLVIFTRLYRDARSTKHKIIWKIRKLLKNDVNKVLTPLWQTKTVKWISVERGLFQNGVQRWCAYR